MRTTLTIPEIRKRRNIPDDCPLYSPWGEVHGAKTLAPGVWKVHCANHGGIKLSDENQAKIPDIFKHPDGWYEEDEAVSVVYHFIPEASPRTAEQKAQDLKDEYWREWEAYYGVVLDPSESRCKRNHLAYEASRV